MEGEGQGDMHWRRDMMMSYRGVAVKDGGVSCGGNSVSVNYKNGCCIDGGDGESSCENCLGGSCRTIAMKHRGVGRDSGGAIKKG